MPAWHPLAHVQEPAPEKKTAIAAARLLDILIRTMELINANQI